MSLMLRIVISFSAHRHLQIYNVIHFFIPSPTVPSQFQQDIFQSGHEVDGDRPLSHIFVLHKIQHPVYCIKHMLQTPFVSNWLSHKSGFYHD